MLGVSCIISQSVLGGRQALWLVLVVRSPVRPNNVLACEEQAI